MPAFPLVGHAPVNLGLDALLETRQDLAHSGALSNIYFLPLASNIRLLVVTGAAFLVLVALATTWGFAALIRRWRPASAHRSPTLSRIRSLTRWVLVAGVIALACAALFLPGGPLFESLALRLLFTAIALFIAVAAVRPFTPHVQHLERQQRFQIRAYASVTRIHYDAGAGICSRQFLGARRVAK